jgi:glycine dehydrogenase subunit 1
MLDAVGVDAVADLFPIPDTVAFDGAFGIDALSEAETRAHVGDLLAANDDLTEFYGRGHYSHYVPSVVEHLTDRGEFLTAYTQYQPEIAQGFLQALFEYQSLLVELTGLDIANASLYDHATAVGEAALLSARVEDGDRVLVPETMLDARREVLETMLAGTAIGVDAYPMADGTVDVAALDTALADDTVMVYAETPTTRGTIEERLAAVADHAHAHDATLCVGTDPVAMSLLEAPGDAGADIVVGDAGVLGLPTSYGMGVGLLAAREAYLRQLPGRLVGASTDSEDRRAYTLTLQTREQHIRKERATSNVCTNQAWAALRVAIHAGWLGPDGLVELAEDCVTDARETARRLDAIDGVEAPVHDRHHFREFVAQVPDAQRVAARLAERGYGVHAPAEDELQVCVAGRDSDAVDGLVGAFREVVA